MWPQRPRLAPLFFANRLWATSPGPFSGCLYHLPKASRTPRQSGLCRGCRRGRCGSQRRVKDGFRHFGVTHIGSQPWALLHQCRFNL